MKRAATILMILTVLASAVVGGQDGAVPDVGLHLAALQGNVEVVRQHIRSGTDLDARDAYGSTPLMIAATFGRAGVAEALIDAGADLHIRNNDGGTPLHAAAFLCRTEIVALLVNRGANKYVRDRYGNTPAETVIGAFDVVKPAYDRLRAALGPFGLNLDDEHLRTTRPLVAEMLRPTSKELSAVEFTPVSRADWPVSTPAAEGLDPDLLAELYRGASAMSNLYSVLVIKNGRLIGERYFNEGSIDRKTLLQSVTKSYTSALVGIALDRGCLENVDQKMLDFFPELADRIDDPRKREITVRQMLQMRAGYPWEESDPAYWDVLLSGSYVPSIVDLPLTHDPGTWFQYSNITSHLLGVIVARACGTDLRSFAEEHLFGPLGVEAGPWRQDRDGYYIGFGELHFTAREAAAFGQLYLEDGFFNGQQLVPAAWVDASHRRYSVNVTSGGVENGVAGVRVREIGYGYQWWSARAGANEFDFAWGHGGQYVVLLGDLEMVIVVTGDPFLLQHDAEAWGYEKGNLNLVGQFIASLPGREEPDR